MAAQSEKIAYRSFAVLGAGAFGTALAAAARRAGREVTLWARRPDLAAEIAASRENRRYLPGLRLDPEIRVTGDLSEALRADALLLVAPAQHLRAQATEFAADLKPGQPLAICAKGVEQGSLKLMTEVLEEVLPGRPPLAVLSGPNFAAEIGAGLPAATTLAAKDPALARDLVAALGSRAFRPYASDDPVGAQVGGAVKNVIAIACGIVAGRKLGDNARAALITRGLAEMARLGAALGARPETLMGLSGLGDLTLTCGALQSRNFSLGVALGEGRALPEILGERHAVTEGIFTADAITELARRHRVDLPIAEAVDAVINRGAALEATIDGLLSRPFRAEGGPQSGCE